MYHEYHWFADSNPTTYINRVAEVPYIYLEPREKKINEGKKQGIIEILVNNGFEKLIMDQMGKELVIKCRYMNNDIEYSNLEKITTKTKKCLEILREINIDGYSNTYGLESVYFHLYEK